MDLKTKLLGDEEERAVSPVIGVILMVAITVILAAVIAAFVLDLGGSIGEEAQAGVNIDVDETDDEIIVTWTAQGNADDVYVTVENADGEDSLDDLQIDNVGNSVQITGNGAWSEGPPATVPSDASGTITVVAEIDGGSTTVVGTDSFDFE